MSFNIVFNYVLGRSGIACGAGLPGLARLLARLGNPQNDYKIIHIAGTNGKGSVAYLTSGMLRQAGRKTGLFISPHLCDPTERIQINGRPIAKPSFAQTLLKVFQEEEEELNFFEILTAAAFLYFSQQKVEYAVVETGLGGRKDPTNVCNPCAAVITSIGIDHASILGSSLAAIAREKAGIIKKGVPVFCGTVNPAAREEIKKAAKTQKAPLHLIEEGEPFSIVGCDFAANQSLLRAADGRCWPLHTLGRRQGINACVAYQLGKYLKISDDAIAAAFAGVNIPGRFEVIQTPKSTFVVDGAHNPQAVELFAEFFKRTPFYGKSVLLCGFMKDKDYPKMLRLLAPHFSEMLLVCPHEKRGAGKEELDAAMPKGVAYRFFDSLGAALGEAKKRPYVACCGSFYLAGAVRGKIARRARTESVLTGSSYCD